MIISKQSVAYHLTPLGWHIGNERRNDAPHLYRPAPDDQVLSLVYKIVTLKNGQKYEFAEEVWRSNDLSLVIRLLGRFGPLPPRR